jgi:hypothetical protein
MVGVDRPGTLWLNDQNPDPSATRPNLKIMKLPRRYIRQQLQLIKRPLTLTQRSNLQIQQPSHHRPFQIVGVQDKSICNYLSSMINIGCSESPYPALPLFSDGSQGSEGFGLGWS